MESTRLLLTEEDVPLGARVAIWLEGNAAPEEDAEGPLVLHALLGGIPMHKKFYPVKGGVIFHSNKVKPRSEAEATNWYPGVYEMWGMEGFRSDVRFMPIQTFSAEDAPAKTEFVVFVDGKRLRYESGENLVRVTTDAEGHLLSTCGYEYAHYKQEYPLPGCAVLVPVSQIGEAMIK